MDEYWKQTIAFWGVMALFASMATVAIGIALDFSPETRPLAKKLMRGGATAILLWMLVGAAIVPENRLERLVKMAVSYVIVVLIYRFFMKPKHPPSSGSDGPVNPPAPSDNPPESSD